MRIGLCQQPRAFICLVLAPHLGKAEPETLISRKAFFGLSEFRILLDALAQRHQSDVAAAIVRSVLTQSEPAVEVNALQRRELAVLVGDTAGALLEFLAVRIRPPVAEIALGIELAALIVKAVGQFMANDHANAAKVHGFVRGLVKEGRLQNAGWEVDVVVR